MQSLYGVMSLEWGDGWHVRREYLNLDLCVVNDSDEVIFVLENKVKSVASDEQLKRYNQKLEDKGYINVPRILLTLTAYVGKMVDGWKEVSYERLAEELQRVNISDEYHKYLLRDYCDYITQLQEIRKSWEYDENKSYLPSMNEQMDVRLCQELRINDVYDKYRHALLAKAVKEKLGNQKVAGYVGSPKTYDNNLAIQEFVNFGMFHGCGLVEANVYVGPYLIGVQVQSGQYRHFVLKLSDGNEKLSGEKLTESWDSMFDKRNRLSDFISAWMNQTKDSTNACFGKEQLPFSAATKLYCSFVTKEDIFFYQYVKISEELTNGQLVDAVVADINKLIVLQRTEGADPDKYWR